MVSGNLIAIIIAVIVVMALVIWLVMWLITKSKGKIDIVLKNYNYSPGDTINGKINLTVKKPIQSKGITIRLIGERIQRNYSRNSTNHNSTNSQRIFDFKQPVEGKKDYQPGELNYDFNLKIPQNLINHPQLTGILGVIANMSTLNSMIKWYLIADLDIPGVDISKKIQINIG
jgi:hypothetical protein